MSSTAYTGALGCTFPEPKCRRAVREAPAAPYFNTRGYLLATSPYGLFPPLDQSKSKVIVPARIDGGNGAFLRAD